MSETTRHPPQQDGKRTQFQAHAHYWWARIRNDFLRLCWFGPTASQYVDEVMSGLKRDRKLAKLISEKEEEIRDRQRRGAE